MSDVFALKAVDYIRGALVQCADLNRIALFLRGSWPLGGIPQQLHPYCEVFVSQCSPDPDGDALGLSGYEYTGTVRIVDTLARSTGDTDWVDVGSGRSQDLPGYSAMVELVIAARNELARKRHDDLGKLEVDGEHACSFSLAQMPLGFGLDRERKTNSWYNVGVLSFSFKTEREREE